MKIGQRQRWIILSGLLVLSLAAAAWVDQTADDKTTVAASVEKQVIVPPVKEVSDSVKRDASLSLPLQKLQRTPMTVGDLDPFAGKSWYVPPPPPPPEPPPKPTAPPLPFRYAGILEGTGGWTVQLAKGNEFLLAGKGDTIDNVYRLEGIEKGQLVFTYLPLSMKQTLPMPSDM